MRLIKDGMRKIIEIIRVFFFGKKDEEVKLEFEIEITTEQVLITIGLIILVVFAVFKSKN